MKSRLLISMIVMIGLAFIVAAPFQPADAYKGTVEMAYVEWSSEVASTNLVKAVIQEKLDYRCDIEPMSVEDMWESVATGETDAMVAAWLPNTHGHYLKAMRDSSYKFEDLGPNLEGTRIGLVVPDVSTGRQTAHSGQRNESYIKAESIADLNDYVDEFRGKIIGIDAGAGVMKRTQEAIEAYNLNYELIDGSEVSMTAELADAIQKKRWIVVTGWNPHWMHGRWSMRYLEDPKNVYGGAEEIHTIVRSGLQQDMPEVYNFLDNFKWTPEQMDLMMVWIQSGQEPYDAALRFMRTHPDLVESWLQ